MTHLKELVAHHEWLSERNIGTQALQRIPLAKVKQIASEAKTLDASRMSEIEPNKRYALATALLALQSTQVMDDIGEMLIKRMMSIHKKGKQSLEKYRLQKQKRTDELVATLRDLLTAYQTEGDAEERVTALEKVIGDRGDAVLEDCETHLAFSGNNYYPFLWQHFKSHRPTLFKILNVVHLRSTSQDKLMEQAIEFLQRHRYSRADWIPTVQIERYISENLEPINILDILSDTEYWLNWTQFFGPISGHDAKLENPVERYLTTVFSYGCNLGQHKQRGL